MLLFYSVYVSWALLAIIGGVTFVAVIVSAFRRNLADGVLCLVFPPYTYLFALFRLEHPQRRGLLVALLGSPALAFLIGMLYIYAVVSHGT